MRRLLDDLSYGILLASTHGGSRYHSTRDLVTSLVMCRSEVISQCDSISSLGLEMSLAR